MFMDDIQCFQYDLVFLVLRLDVSCLLMGGLSICGISAVGNVIIDRVARQQDFAYRPCLILSQIASFFGVAILWPISSSVD